MTIALPLEHSIHFGWRQPAHCLHAAFVRSGQRPDLRETNETERTGCAPHAPRIALKPGIQTQNRFQRSSGLPGAAHGRLTTLPAFLALLSAAADRLPGQGHPSDGPPAVMSYNPVPAGGCAPHRRSPPALHAAPLLLSCCLLLALIVSLSCEPHLAPHLQVWAWGCLTVRLGVQCH
jgi:hypothetical protein